jgi:hypothetical protein
MGDKQHESCINHGVGGVSNMGTRTSAAATGSPPPPSMLEA